MASEMRGMLSWIMLPSEYIATYSKESTRRIRKSGILKYLRLYLGPGVTDIDAGMREYLSSRDSAAVARDLAQYYVHPDIDALAPMSRASYLSSIECYLQDACEFQLPPLQRKLRERSKREKTVAVVQELCPTREIWQAVLSHLGTRHRAELLLCLSGGLRIGEVLSLWMSDVFLDETPCHIELRGAATKNGLPRRTFVSREAADALRAYLRVRDVEVAKGLAKCQNCNIRHDLREIFPLDMVSGMSALGGGCCTCILLGSGLSLKRSVLPIRIMLRAGWGMRGIFPPRTIAPLWTRSGKNT